MYADLDEKICLEHWKSFNQYGPNGSPHVCRLRKAVYGMNQAPVRVIQDVMITQHGRQLRIDSGAYVYGGSDATTILAMMAIYMWTTS